MEEEKIEVRILKAIEGKELYKISEGDNYPHNVTSLSLGINEVKADYGVRDYYVEETNIEL